MRKLCDSNLKYVTEYMSAHQMMDNIIVSLAQ